MGGPYGGIWFDKFVIVAILRLKRSLSITLCKDFLQMGIRRRFNQILGIKDSVEDERKKFVQRTNQIIFHVVDTGNPQEFAYGAFFKFLCFEMGLNADDMWRRYHRKSDYILDEKEYPPEIRSLTGDDFEKTLLVLCVLYFYFEGLPNNRQKWLSEQVQTVFSRSTCDIGIRWKDGFFYPSGAKELDESLIDETLTWLNDFPNEKKDYQHALEHYLRDKSSGDVIKNCYSAIEGLARNILGNNKTLDNNKDELLSKISLSDGWKTILANFIKYAHDFRHASEQRHEITKQETEGYLYMTGLVIQLIIESKQIG